jgi:hypothetical protein
VLDRVIRSSLIRRLHDRRYVLWVQHRTGLVSYTRRCESRRGKCALSPQLHFLRRTILARQGCGAQKALQDRRCSRRRTCRSWIRPGLPRRVRVHVLPSYRRRTTEQFFDSDPPTEFGRAARATEARLRSLQHAWLQEASDEEFNAKLDELRTLREEYRKLPERRKQKIRELERALFETQLRHYLEQFDIASADIPHIKDGRRVMLSSYGIDNAADVTGAALDAVPGFGPFLIMQLITWRQSLQATFKFDPSRGIDPADIQRVDHDVAKRRAEIEALLSKGPSELNDLRRRIIAARGQLQDQLEKALMDVAQAQADERAAT